MGSQGKKSYFNQTFLKLPHLFKICYLDTFGAFTVQKTFIQDDGGKMTM